MDASDISILSAVIGGIIGIIGTILAAYLSKKRMRVAYEIITVSSLLKIGHEVKDKIKVEYENEPIKNLYSFQVKVKNTGNTVVEKLPILFEFDLDTKILNDINETIPEREFNIKKSDNNKESEIKYEIDFLNPNDQITFNFLTADNKSEKLKLHSRAIGLDFYETSLFSKTELLRQVTLEIIMQNPIIRLTMP